MEMADSRFLKYSYLSSHMLIRYSVTILHWILLLSTCSILSDMVLTKQSITQFVRYLEYKQSRGYNRCKRLKPTMHLYCSFSFEVQVLQFVSVFLYLFFFLFILVLNFFFFLLLLLYFLSFFLFFFFSFLFYYFFFIYVFLYIFFFSYFIYYFLLLNQNFIRIM